MKLARLACALLMGIGLNAAMAARADFDAYLARPEPEYKWELKGEKDYGGTIVYDLHLVSQVWQGIKWEHRLQLVKPKVLKHPGFVTLLNTGGSGSVEENMLASMVANATGGYFAILYNIPNQPLYGGKNEDALIVYTWQKFLETGDESWPLHFPMAKAVIKSMDALQAFAKTKQLAPLNDFLITGASKRGWTTWLVGAAKDKRVKAIAPMVIDVLNVKLQMKHQLESYGKPSEQIDDYSAGGMVELLGSKKADRLMELEDPYSYRDRITMPKLIVLGTNDRYWSQDSLNLYWDGLKGPKWVVYLPNSGHGLDDRGRLLATLGAYARTIAAGALFPKMDWAFKPDSTGLGLTVSSTTPSESARLFRVFAPTRDFRDQKWTSEPMTKSGNGWTGRLDTPATGFAAMYAEVTFVKEGKPFTLTSQLQILGKK